MSDDTRSRACGFSGHQALDISLISGSPSTGQRCPPGNTSTGRRTCFRSPTNVCKAGSAQDTSTAPFLTCAFQAHRACLKPLNSCIENCRHQPGEPPRHPGMAHETTGTSSMRTLLPKHMKTRPATAQWGGTRQTILVSQAQGAWWGILEPPHWVADLGHRYLCNGCCLHQAAFPPYPMQGWNLTALQEGQLSLVSTTSRTLSGSDGRGHEAQSQERKSLSSHAHNALQF